MAAHPRSEGGAWIHGVRGPLSAHVRCSPPHEVAESSDVDYEEESDESEEEEESDDDSRADDYCFRCGQRGHWAQDCGQPYSYYGYGRY